MRHLYVRRLQPIRNFLDRAGDRYGAVVVGSGIAIGWSPLLAISLLKPSHPEIIANILGTVVVALVSVLLAWFVFMVIVVITTREEKK